MSPPRVNVGARGRGVTSRASVTMTRLGNIVRRFVGLVYRPFFRYHGGSANRAFPLGAGPRRSSRDDADAAARRDRVHRVGHDELHHRSLRSATIFGPCRPHLRSDQLRSAIARRRRSATRGQKKADVSVQSRGQVGLSRAAGRGNRIFSAGHVRLCYSFGQRVNFLSRPPAAPTATCGRGTHTHGLRSPRARGAGRGGTALLQ